MTATTASAAPGTRSKLLPVVLITGLVGTLAPLIADLRGGGLLGIGMYDDAVYYAAATGLVHGRVPYRDFLLLHPPGIVVALSPFALLGDLTTDSTGYLAARLAWLLLGGVAAALVVLVLWPVHRAGALVGGLFAGLYHPAVTAAHTLVIEQAQTVLILVAVLLVSRGPTRPSAPGWRAPGRWLLLGAVLALLPALKIWGVVPLALVGVWVLLRAGLRRLLLVAAGVAACGCAVFLPFFLADPHRMWRYVVVDQIGREAFSTSPLVRLTDMEGLGALYNRDTAAPLPLFVAVGAAWLVAIALACRLPLGRVAVTGHLVLVAMLLSVPSWISHYPALTTSTAALIIGCATAVSTTAARGPLRAVGAAAASLTVVALLAGQTTVHYGTVFPGARLARAQAVPGCMTADDPTTLILLNRLGPDLDHGCRLVVDLGGYTYDQLVHGHQRSRHNNPHWQRTALTYLSSGDVAVISRYTTRRFDSFTAASLREIRSWPVVARKGSWVARRPPTG